MKNLKKMFALLMILGLSTFAVVAQEEEAAAPAEEATEAVAADEATAPAEEATEAAAEEAAPAEEAPAAE